MSTTFIKGTFFIKGKQPDGDSIRFVADDPSLFEDLYRYHRMRFTRADGSIQLRLEGIDTPETHYGPRHSQPYGNKARDELLKLLGYDLNRLSINHETGAVLDDGGQVVRGAIITEGADANGRPISMVYTEAAAPSRLNDGDKVFIDPAMLKASANYRMVEQGHAYATLYTSLPHKLRVVFRDAARAARNKQLGLWPLDQSGDFVLDSFDDIVGPDATLILPKLFRRGVDYLKAVGDGFRGNLGDWLDRNSGGGRPENDLVLLGSFSGRAGSEVPLSNLISQRNRHVIFSEDVLDIVFVEK